MHSVKCKVVFHCSPLWPKVKRTGIYTRSSALQWIKSVGWDHVSAGLCDYPKCLKSKAYIDKGALIRLPNGRPALNPVYVFPTSSFLTQ